MERSDGSALKKDDRTEGLSGEQSGETRYDQIHRKEQRAWQRTKKGVSGGTQRNQPYHREKEIEAGARHILVWILRMREDADASAHITVEPAVRLTPSPKFREDPSM